MERKQQIQIMLDLQEQMNSTVDPNWRKANNEWYRAIWVECAELMDHVGYKWWKKQLFDKQAAKLEVVDIMHFMLSISLLNNQNAEDIVENFDRNLIPGDVKQAIDALAYYQLENVNTFACYNHLNGVMYNLDMSFDELYITYVSKNVLNIFRQENGYKEGTYLKTWKLYGADAEDNEALSELLNAYDGTEEDFIESLKRDLTIVYKETLLLS